MHKPIQICRGRFNFPQMQSVDFAASDLDGLKSAILDNLPEQSVLEILNGLALNDLELRNCAIDSHKLKRVLDFQKLNSLIISGCIFHGDSNLFSSPGVRFLRRMQFINQLGFSKAKIDSISNLRNLEVLAFTNCDISDAMFENWETSNSRISSLCMQGCFDVSANVLAGFSKSGLIEDLVAPEGRSIDDDCILRLSATCPLVSLHIWDASITDMGLAVLAKLRSLTEISLSMCSDITESGLLNLSESRSLRRIFLSNCRGVTSRNLLKNLRKVNPNLLLFT